MYTFGQLKTDLRRILFPTGEAAPLVPAHDKFFVDALIDLQTYVECLQQDNTSLIPHCATLYNCGLTVFEAPRGSILNVSVMDKLDPVTGEENANLEDNYCSAIEYLPVDYTYVEQYLARSRRYGRCLPVGPFFGLVDAGCQKTSFPIPTDEGVPVNLPELPLGYHYPQTSTDRSYGRASAGVWAMDRGKIYLAPWIQSTETVIIRWDGIKRTWSDEDPMEEDPLLSQAIEAYVRWQHAWRFDKEFADAEAARDAYYNARAELIHACVQETQAKPTSGSRARSAPGSTTNLYYNTAQTATANCPLNQIGDSVTVTIPAGTVASAISVADANQKAQDEAQRQAQARLDCTTQTTEYSNDAQTAIASCQGSAGAPPPEGAPVTITVPAGTISSTISKADANAQALALAQSQAAAQLKCAYWNAEQSFTATCPEDPNITSTKKVAAHTYSSATSQQQADQLAKTEAENLANADMAAQCEAASNVYWNTAQNVQVKGYSQNTLGRPCTITVNVLVLPNKFSSTISQADANQKAIAIGNFAGGKELMALQQARYCGTTQIVYPPA